MSGSFATPDFLFAHIDKTGSQTVRSFIKLIYGGENLFVPFGRFLGEHGLPSGYEHMPVVSTIRNPFTYFVSYWLYFKPQGNPELAPYSSFGEWVRNCPDAYVKKYNLFVPPGTKMVKLENQLEDFIRVMREVGAPLTAKIEEEIKTLPRMNVNTERKCPYREYYDDLLIRLVLDHNSLIFDLYYPDREFPEEN